MNYESYNQSFEDDDFDSFTPLQDRVWQLEAMREGAEATAHAATKELAEVVKSSQDRIRGLTETIEILKQQVAAAMAEAAKARQKAEEWRKAYDDLAKCL